MKIYSFQNTVSPEAFDSIEFLQTMDELDSVPTIMKLSSAIDNLSNGKSQGADNTPPSLITYKSRRATTIA